MRKNELKTIAAKGEDSRLQFKQDIRNVDAKLNKFNLKNTESIKGIYNEIVWKHLIALK